MFSDYTLNKNKLSRQWHLNSSYVISYFITYGITHGITCGIFEVWAFLKKCCLESSYNNNLLILSLFG